MNTIYHRSNIRSKQSGLVSAAMLMALMMVLLISLTFTAKAHSPWPHTSDLSLEQQSTGAQSSAPSQLTLTISSQGITPTSATVSVGIVHLIVQNQSNQEQLTLRVSRENGTLVREIVAPEKAQEWATELELSEPGQYVITVVGNTSGSCQITAQVPAPEG